MKFGRITGKAPRMANREAENIPREGTPGAVQSTYTPKNLRAAITGRYGAKSIREWARLISSKEEVCLTHGTLARALKGAEPKRAELRVALGLPALIPAPACRACGVVHVKKRCPRRPALPAWVTRGADFLAGRQVTRHRPGQS